MSFTDDAIDQAHKLLLKLEEDPRLPGFYRRHPGLAGMVEEARRSLLDIVQRLGSASISRARAMEKARGVQETLAQVEALLTQDSEAGPQGGASQLPTAG